MKVIDWVTAKVPFRVEAGPVRDGYVLALSGDGSVEWMKDRRVEVAGSYESRLFVKSVGDYLEISGNPTKFFQGHNLFGIENLRTLVFDAVNVVACELNLERALEDHLPLLRGEYSLSRVDCTGMLALPTRADVRAVLRAATVRARSRHGRATARGGTVYFGQHSRRWSLKLYSKGDELEAVGKGHSLPTEIEYRKELEAYADNKLRCELTLRGMELEKRGLRHAKAWEWDTPMQELQKAVEGIEMSEKTQLPSEVLSTMSGKLVAVYEAWRAGHDVRGLYCRRTFYRYRSELLAVGIDISTPCPDAPEPSNVVPLGRVLEPVWAGIPQWAIGTSVLYDPDEVCQYVVA